MNDIYAYTVPVFIKSLGGVKNVLTKAQAFIQEKGIDEKTLLADKLWDDMFPLARQIQISTDQAKGSAARLAGVEIPKYEDTEQTIDELLRRVDKTIAFLESLPEASFKDAANRKITLSYFPDKYMTGFDYAREYAVPNFLFHVVTAYDLVRKNGVPIGKADYTNGMPLKDL